MKHTKIFFTLLVLAAALLAFGCTSAAVTDANLQKNAKEAFAKGPIDDLVTSLVQKAATNEVSSDDVAKEVEKTNKNDFLKSLGIKIKDTKAGVKIDKGATAETLKGRFTKE